MIKMLAKKGRLNVHGNPSLLEVYLKSETFIIPPPPILPAANPISLPYCKLYISGIVAHPSVSGLYGDSAAAAAQFFFPPLLSL